MKCCDIRGEREAVNIWRWSKRKKKGRQKGRSGRSLQDRESAVEADWWRGGASGSQSPAEKSTWAFLGTLDSPSSPRHLRLSILSPFLSQLYPYLPSFDSSSWGDSIYIPFFCKILTYLYSSTRLSIISFYSRHLPGLRSEQSIWTNGTMSTTSFVCIFSMKHQPFNSILFGFKCSNLICSLSYGYLPG